MEKKNNLNIIIIIVVIIALIVLIVLKNTSKKQAPAPIDQNQIELEGAVKFDKTTDITKSLNDIKVDDTSDTDLESVNKEIENL